MIAPGAISPFNRASIGDGAAAWTLGRAVKLDGTNDYVLVNNLSGVAVDTDFFGISCWFKLGAGWPYSAAVLEGLFTSADSGAIKFCFLLMDPLGTTTNFEFTVYNDAGGSIITLKGNITDASYSAGDIIHIAAVLASDGAGIGGSARMWVNGVLNKSNGNQGTKVWLTEFGANTYVGAERLNANRYYQGEIGDITLFGGVNLTDADVTTLYNAGAGSDPSDIIPTTNMYFWHQYNESPTTTACIDSSSEETRTGTLTNFAGGGDADERPEFNP